MKTCGNRGGPCGRSHLRRYETGSRAAVTKLALAVPAPRPQRAVSLDAQAVPARVHGSPIGRGPDLYWGGAACRRSVTELPAGVVAPTPQTAIGLHPKLCL